MTEMIDTELKKFLLAEDGRFWDMLNKRSGSAATLAELIFLSNLRKKAVKGNLKGSAPVRKKIKLALAGGYTFYPFQDVLEHLLFVSDLECDLFIGEFDNYYAEILEEKSRLYEFSPDVVLLWPSGRRCRYDGGLDTDNPAQRSQAEALCNEILGLCSTLHERCTAEVILCNFMLPPYFDPGPFRTRTLGSEWSFKKLVNLELGLRTPDFVHLCDCEYLSCRKGLLEAHDARAWFESKQPCSADLLVDVAREVVQIIGSLKGRPPKKLLVLDLDNTLWGGVIGDDGLDGIELGDTSPRGEAFKEFQKYILSLSERGVLLAVCSKNEHQTAVEPFEKHPEMVLKRGNFVSFVANWKPKSENIASIARQLSLGLDSFVFVDDNPAEIEIVRQFLPQVTAIQLGEDPADYVAQLKDSRLFEPVNITAEDAGRTEQYLAEARRKEIQSSVTDITAFLTSLEMTAEIREFDSVDVPRITQLINRSNQFNLTTRRRNESEVRALIGNSGYICFAMRLSDRFGDYGLISVVIAKVDDNELEIDTWLMSCRVLERQVEEVTADELCRLARSNGMTRVHGIYLRTGKNEMVRDLYGRLGFRLASDSEDRRDYYLDVGECGEKSTKIQVLRRAYESD